MFRTIFLLLTILLIFSSVIISGFKVLSRSSTEYDEGAYLTTFLLVNSGNTLYKETFFSQFPGFFYSTYPGFLLFGQTLEAGRLAVFFWSLITLLGILWLAYEAGNILFGILAIAILYTIPIFFNQSITFHADAIPSAFSVLSISSMLRFWKKYNFLWFVLSIVFLSFGILVKLEFSIILSLILIFSKIISGKKIPFKKVIFFIFFSLFLFSAIFYLSILPFGAIMPFYKSAFLTRMQGTLSEQFSPTKLFIYLIDSKTLLMIIITSAVLSIHQIFQIKNKGEKFIFLILLLWSLTTFFLLIIYRPLFPHHLVLLTVPFSLLFSYLLILSVKNITSLKFIKIGIFLFTTYTFLNVINFSFSQPQNYKNDLLNKGVDIININSSITDYVVSDDGFLNALSKRLPPPWLVDISAVRVKSGSLPSEDFGKALQEYKPKLIMAWAGRIKKIKDFEQILKNNNYQLLESLDKDHEAFILSK